MTSRSYWITSGELRLEGALHEGGDAFSSVVLHPHPQYGGDMHNHVVLSIAETLAVAGGTVLRFNFRGAGRSDGAYDDGRGEAEDARAAVGTMRTLLPDAPFVLAGYSFGAMIVAAIASAVLPEGLILVSPPLAYGALTPLPEQTRSLAVTGDLDPVAPASLMAALTGPSLRTAIVPGADHNWWPGVDEMALEVSRFVEAVLIAP